jgi:hypothetical protein
VGSAADHESSRRGFSTPRLLQRVPRIFSDSMSGDSVVFLEPPSGTLPPLFSLCFTHGTLRTALEPVPCTATLVMLIPILVDQPELAPQAGL